MSTTELFFVALVILFLSAAAMFAVRNEWVYHKRITLINKDYEKYSQLCDYDEMMNRWWVWDVEKFVRTRSPRREQG